MNYISSTLKLLCILCLSFLLSAYTSFEGLNKIIQRGYIVVSFTPNETAFFTVVDKNKDIKGIDREVAELIAKQLGVKLVIKTTASDWNSVIEEVADSKADIGISYLSNTVYRSKKVLFSEPYVRIRQALLFNNLSLARQRRLGNIVIKDMFNETNGMTIGVFTGSSYEDFARFLFPGVKMKTFDSTEELIKNILLDNIDALLIDELELYSVFRKDPGLKVKLTEVILKDQPDLISVAVDPNNNDLHRFVNNVLKLRQVMFTVDSAYQKALQNNLK
jgi:polar amino acid transport system substrate-binding protein